MALRAVTENGGNKEDWQRNIGKIIDVEAFGAKNQDISVRSFFWKAKKYMMEGKIVGGYQHGESSMGLYAKGSTKEGKDEVEIEPIQKIVDTWYRCLLKGKKKEVQKLK